MPLSPSLQPLAPHPRANGVAFVTGAAGFVGRHAASALVGAGWTVVGLGGRRPEHDGLDLVVPGRWVEGDLTRRGLEAAAAKDGLPEIVIHCAGAGSVAAARADPARDFRRTLGGLAEVLDFMRERAADARLVLASSAAVYGAGESVRSEDHSLAPISAYGVHKLMAETMALGWARLYGLDLAVIRFFSIYGPGLRKQIFWDMARRLGRSPAELELGGEGDEARDFLYIDDAVRLIGLVAAAEKGGTPLVVNGGSGRAVTVREAAEALARAMASPSRVVFSGRAREGDPKRLTADVTRLKTLGFAPAFTLDQGLTHYVAWAADAQSDRAQVDADG